MIAFELTIIGSGSAVPSLQRAAASQLLTYGQHRILIDCAEGTQMRLQQLGLSAMRINYVLISHLHGDHYFGLIGLIQTMHLLGRSRPLMIFGPPLLIDILRLQLEVSHTELRYPLEFTPLEIGGKQMILKNEQLSIYSFPLNHRIPTWGFLISEIQAKPNLRPEFVETYHPEPDAMKQIKQGAGFRLPDGTWLLHEDITYAARKPRSYAYCSDTAYVEELSGWISHADMLYHEATFMDMHKAEAEKTFHSTTTQAAAVALKAQVKRLLIGHFSTRYDDTKSMENEAKMVFPYTTAVKDGDRFLIE